VSTSIEVDAPSRPPAPAAGGDSAADATGLIEDATVLTLELRALLHDQFQLFTQETRLAAKSMMTMIAAAVWIGMLLATAWLGLVGALAYWRRDRRRRRTELAAAETRAFLADPLVELVRALLEQGSVRVDATGRPVLDGEPGWTLDRPGLYAALARAPGAALGTRGPDLLLRRAASAVAAGHARLAPRRARGLVREADVVGPLPQSLRHPP